jgi:hypothetical protein
MHIRHSGGRETREAAANMSCVSFMGLTLFLQIGCQENSTSSIDACLPGLPGTGSPYNGSLAGFS